MCVIFENIITVMILITCVFLIVWSNIGTKW